MLGQTYILQDIFSNAKDLGKELKLIVTNLQDGNPKDFRSLSDKFIDQNKKDVLLIYTLSGEKISYLLRTDKNNKKINCSLVLKSNQEVINGRGGGTPDMAQGSGDSQNHGTFITQIETSLKGL